MSDDDLHKLSIEISVARTPPGFLVIDERRLVVRLKHRGEVISEDYITASDLEELGVQLQDDGEP